MLVSGFAHHGGIQWGSNIPLAWDAWLYFARIPTLKRMELVLSSGNWWIIFAQYDIYFVHSRIQTCDLRFVGFCRPRSLSFPSWPDPKHRWLVFVGSWGQWLFASPSNHTGFPSVRLVMLNIFNCEAAPRGTQAWNFLHEVDFGHNLTIEVHCTSLNKI